MKAKNEWVFGIKRDFLIEIFDYDDDGYFVRKNNTRGVGWTDPKTKYRRIQIGKEVWMEHRLVWIYHNGDIPEGKTVDHRDHVVSNNKIQNLRLASRSEQNKYQRKRKQCSSDFIGVCFRKRSGKFEAMVNTYKDGVKKSKYLGSFDDDNEAAIIRDQYIIKNNLTEWNLLNISKE